MSDDMKKLIKGTLAIVTIATAVTVFVKFADEMYDLRLVLAALGGAFGYQPLCNLFNKIKKLQ